MKRLYITLAFVHIALLSCFAQIGEHRSELAFGFNGGYVLSNIGFMPEVPQDNHEGITAGLTVRYTCEKYFSSVCAIVAEMNYVQAGWKERIWTPEDLPVINATTGLPEKYEREINYLQIPVFARMGWGRERRGFQFFVQAGPQVGFLLSEKTRMNFSLDNMTPKGAKTGRTSSVVAQYTMPVEKKVDYGITAGLGLEFSHRKAGHFLIEGRYYYGLGDIYGNSKKDYFGRSNVNTIYIKAAYLFDIAKTNNSNIK